MAGIERTRRISGGDAVRCIRWFAGVSYEKDDAKRRIANMSGEWIPVSERLPEYMDTVLTYVSQAGTPIVHCGFYDDGRDAGVGNSATADEMRGWWAHTTCLGEKKLEGEFEPTHWMPLPTPPTDAK